MIAKLLKYVRTVTLLLGAAYQGYCHGRRDTLRRECRVPTDVLLTQLMLGAASPGPRGWWYEGRLIYALEIESREEGEA